jgi:hypothetical protein
MLQWFVLFPISNYIILDPIFSTQHLPSSRLGGLSLLHPKVMSSRNVHLCGGDPWICGVLQTVGTINSQHVINRSINRQVIQVFQHVPTVETEIGNRSIGIQWHEMTRGCGSVAHFQTQGMNLQLQLWIYSKPFAKQTNAGRVNWIIEWEYRLKPLPLWPSPKSNINAGQFSGTHFRSRKVSIQWAYLPSPAANTKWLGPPAAHPLSLIPDPLAPAKYQKANEIFILATNAKETHTWDACKPNHVDH